MIFSNGQTKLYGTLFKPQETGIFPAIVVAHGSGREHRKLPGVRSVAQMYADAGFVTLLFDKRGVGDSDGEYVETPNFFVAAGDIIAAIHFIKSRNDVDASRIGLYGHSQAGWTMPLAAVACEDVSFMIVSCGGGVSPQQQGIYHHYTSKQRERKDSEEEVHELAFYLTSLHTYLATKRDYDRMLELYEVSKDKAWFGLLENSFEKKPPPPPSQLNHPGWLFFKKIMHDPELTLVSLRIPVLVLLAEKDQNVPSTLAKKIWQESFEKSGMQEKLTVVWLPNETHALFERKNGIPQMREAFSSPIKEWLRDWIQ